MNILLAIIFSSIMLNCTQNLNMSGKNNHYDEKTEFNNEDNNYLIDDFGDRLEFHKEEEVLDYLDNIDNKKEVFKQVYLNNEGESEGFIHYAVQFDKVAVVKKIVDNADDTKELVNLKTSEGSTPLHLAALAGDFELIEFFIEKGAKFNDRDNNGFTVFHYAAQSSSKDSEKIIENLLSLNNKMTGNNKVDLIESRTEDNSTLLHWAILFDRCGLLQTILNYATLDFINEKAGRLKLTALNLAEKSKKYEFYKLINDKYNLLTEHKQ